MFIGPIDQIKPFVINADTSGLVFIGLKVFKDGSPFVFSDDVESGIGENGYDLILLPEYPPFLAPDYQMEHLLEDQKDWNGAVKEYIKATLEGSLNKPYHLTEPDCESLLVAFSNAELEESL